ncbi:tRNA (adenosine(37)-N6)-threonylcarbamoyltransferase complex dimerization subunit type 1 TsaB [Neorhizobium sp. NPDC001467]|uniref:tRNA (adenosine(37)-N6)-threonylcarbamoyltransferase complex dimerization subunit type 1 TsaB n=1 Tax=Neorhizobium sp. NPDC001467 TaxID=3390595 RepID=UPI003D05FF81
MIVLALDTAGIDCSVALYDAASDRILSVQTEMIGKGHAEKLMAQIEAALAEAAITLQDVGRIAVTIGPGSFTGIRVGVAAARGLALSLGIEAFGITTLETMAAHHLAGSGPHPVVAAMDAKRGEIYAQPFGADGSAIDEPRALTPHAVAELAARHGAILSGTGAMAIAAATSGEAGEPAAQAVPDRFDIATVAKLGASKPGGSEKPKPLYLRGPDAKPQIGFALARS